MASLAQLTLRTLLLPALILLSSGCSLMPDYPARYIEAPMTPEGVEEPEEVAVSGDEQAPNRLLARLYKQHDEWRGVKYRMGGMSKSGTDCSGFVKLTFASLFDLELPRSTHQQVKAGIDVNVADLQSGDLVFFKINKRTQHVGIYLEESKFLHASTSRGVMVSSMTHPYWQSRYWKSVRVS